MIHAWDMVRIDDYLAIEKLTALTGDHPEYLGWVPLEREKKQKPYQGIKSLYKTVGRSGMYIVKAEADQVEKIVDMSIRAFETDVNVGGAKGDCPPGFDSVEWHKQMAREGHLYQAMIGKDLVGAAIIFQDETKNSIYIGRIFIDSIHHRRGYGIRLMECIEKDFPCAAEFNLDTPCWNERTNAFYKRLGYRVIKIEDGFAFYQKRKSEPDIIQHFT